MVAKIKKITNENRKSKTILNLVKNVLKYLLILVVIIILLNMYDVDTSGIVAGLGIVGVVVGFALQDILKDFFAGITIIIDNQYSIGDYVSINGFMGTVISIGLRSTKIINGYGEIKIISNRNILEVTNYSLNNSILQLELNVNYNTNVQEVEEMLEKCFIEIKSMKYVLGEVKLLGIDKIDNLTIMYKIIVECETMKQFEVKRKVYKLIKEKFDKKNIKVFFNQLEVRYGE